MRRAVACAVAGALLLGACDGGSEPPADELGGTNSDPAAAPALPAPGEARLPLQPADFPVLQSKDCGEVVQFYREALAAREFDRAALVWNDPVIDGARLEAVLDGYAQPQIQTGEPVVQGAAGSLYCTVPGTLTDASDLARPPVEGELVLRRANDVPGATADQLRWTLQSSTFVETLERSGRS